MEDENIDWDNIESVFEEDETYESINAPKWVDLNAPCQTMDDEAWFCKPGCKHPKCAEDYLKPKHYSKVKLLRSMTISEIFPFRDKTSRKVKAENGGKESNSLQHLHEDNENSNPNLSTPPLSAKTIAKKSWMKGKAELDELRENSAKSSNRKKQQGLKSTFSARNLVAGREILSQITELCAELKKMATKGSKKGAMEKAWGSGGVEERVKEKERMPLLVVKERRPKQKQQQ